IACLGVILAPWLLTALGSASVVAPVDESLCANAQYPVPNSVPPCVPKYVITLPGGAIVGSFDISWVDSSLHKYVLAASRTTQAGCTDVATNPTCLGPSSNPGIVKMDTVSLAPTIIGSNQPLTNNTTPFAGACSALGVRDLTDMSGPNGATIVEKFDAGNEV